MASPVKSNDEPPLATTKEEVAPVTEASTNEKTAATTTESDLLGDAKETSNIDQDAQSPLSVPSDATKREGNGSTSSGTQIGTSVRSDSLDSANLSSAADNSTVGQGISLAPASVSSTSIISPQTEPLKWDDFTNPCTYELRNFVIKRSSTEQWELKVTQEDYDVVKLGIVASGSPADRANVPAGCFITAINGQRISNSSDIDSVLNRLEIALQIAVLRRPAYDPNEPALVPPSWNSLPNCKRILLRIDTTNKKADGICVGRDRGGRVMVKNLKENGAGAAAGLNVYDRIVSVNGAIVITSVQFRTMRGSSGNPFDLVVERPNDPADVPAMPPILSRAHGDPSIGVPPIPGDVKDMVDSSGGKVVDNVKKSEHSRTVSCSPSSSGSNIVSPSSGGKKAKLDKKVVQEKLVKPSP